MGRGESSDEMGRADQKRAILTVLRCRELVARSADRVAELGEWPEWIDPQASLTARIPTDVEPGSGFDAGIACCLDLIPRPKQKLAATLHAAYTPAAVEQVIRESERGPGASLAESETGWWLAACSVCREERLGPEEFSSQIREFERMAVSERARARAAAAELERMRSLFTLRDGIPFSEEDGGMQGAYVSGHPLAVTHARNEGIWFIGTYEESLGLEDFEWGSKTDDLGRPKSGPVHGSKQFARASSEEELARALAVARVRLGV